MARTTVGSAGGRLGEREMREIKRESWQREKERLELGMAVGMVAGRTWPEGALEKKGGRWGLGDREGELRERESLESEKIEKVRMKEERDIDGRG